MINMSMQDILMDILIAVVAVIIGAYVLNVLGYLTHKSPMNMFGPGGGSKNPAGVDSNFSPGTVANVGGGSPENIGQTALPPGSSGANEGAFGRVAII